MDGAEIRGFFKNVFFSIILFYVKVNIKIYHSENVFRPDRLK